MIERKSPAEVEWQTGKIPDANLCHSDTRIIVWYSTGKDSVSVAILRPGDYNENASLWYDSKHFIWDRAHNQIQYWGWWKFFGKQ